MAEKQKSFRQRSAPASPLDPYRSILEQNPIEAHFTDKRLRKHMRHAGLILTPARTKDGDQSSLSRDEYQIQNSGREKLRQFRRQFVTTMADTIQEIDRVRQVEFRNQLELWDKMYSNRIQRINAHNKRVERKYGLFVDRELKRELIRESLTKMANVPSVSIPRIIPDVVPTQTRNQSPLRPTTLKRTPSAPTLRKHVDEARSRLDDLIQRLKNLEDDFSTFQSKDFRDCRIDVDFLKTTVETLSNDRDALQDEVNKLKRDIEELQMDLNEVVKDQDMLKIIQLEHEEKISKLTSLVVTLETASKAFEKLWEEILKIRQEQANDKKVLETEDKRQQNEIDRLFDSLNRTDFTHAFTDLNTKLQTLTGNHEHLSGMHNQLRIEFDDKNKTVENPDQHSSAGRVKSIEDGRVDLEEQKKLRSEVDNLKEKVRATDGYVSHMLGRIDALEREKVDHTDYSRTKETIYENKRDIGELKRILGERIDQRIPSTERPIPIDNSSEIAALRLEINEIRETHAANNRIFDGEISTLKRRLQALETVPKTIQTSPRSTVPDAKYYNEDLKIIQDKQKEFDDILKKFALGMQSLEDIVGSFDSKIIQLDGKINQQRRELEQMITDSIGEFEKRIKELRDDLLSLMNALKKTIDDELKKVKDEAAILKARLDKLEEDLKRVKPLETKKEDALPYVEKFVPIDLFEIDWKKYRPKKQENTSDQ